MAKKVNKQEGTKAVFACRLSYAHLDAPYAAEEDSQKKYSVCCLVPKEDKDALRCIKAAMEEAKKQGVASKPKWKGRVPANLKTPLRDGDVDKEDKEDFAGMMFLNASSKRAVPVMNTSLEDIDPLEAYSGCYALVSVNFFPYDSNGSRGVAAGLNAVLKTQDGERLGGARNARGDFDGLDLDDDVDIDDL